MPSDEAFVTLDEVLDAKRELNVSVRRNAWRPMLLAVVCGTGIPAAFLAATWLWGFVEPMKSTGIYWLVGVASFVISGLWPLIDFVQEFMYRRRSLMVIEDRLRSGESVPRPNPAMYTDLAQKAARGW